jgi:hypothetical protein
VLGLSLGMWFAAASALAGLIYCVTPFFGIYLTGIPAAVALVATAGLFAWGGWASYLLRPAGWWLSLALSVLLPVSGILSFARQGAGAMYRHMGLSDFQIEAMSARDASQAVVQVVMMGLVSAAAIGYMLWIRRHFFPRAG